MSRSRYLVTSLQMDIISVTERRLLVSPPKDTYAMGHFHKKGQITVKGPFCGNAVIWAIVILLSAFLYSVWLFCSIGR